MLGLEPATKDAARDGYMFERPVDFQDAADAGFAGSTSTSAGALCSRPFVI